MNLPFIQPIFDAAITFEDVSNGVATVTYLMNNVKGTVDFAGTKQSLPQLKESKVTVKVDTKTGKLLDVQGLPTMSSGGSPGFTEADLKNALQQSFTQLPQTGKAKPGDTWEQDVPIPMSLPDVKVDGTLKARTKYDENTKRDGVNAAKLTQTVEGPLSIDLGQNGAGVTMKAKLTGSSTTYVDLKTGLPLSSDGKAVMDTEMTMDVGAQAGGKVVVNFEANSVVQVTRK